MKGLTVKLKNPSDQWSHWNIWDALCLRDTCVKQKNFETVAMRVCIKVQKKKTHDIIYRVKSWCR